MTSTDISIEITKDEALVLFEFLSRIIESDELKTKHISEDAVMASILCALEEKLTEPFKGNYIELLNAARNRLSN